MRKCPYVEYPYVEWYSDNGTVVLELHLSKVEVIDGSQPPGERPPRSLSKTKEAARRHSVIL